MINSKQRCNSVYVQQFMLQPRQDDVPKPAFGLSYVPSGTDYAELARHLHPLEFVYYDSLRFEMRIKSYLSGRLAAKRAVAALTGEENLSGVLIRNGIFSQPILTAGMNNIQVSITHCDDFGAALAYPESHPMGIDIEKIDSEKRDVFEGQMTEAEKGRIRSLSICYDAGLTLLWTAKEALSKVLRTGLTTPLTVYEVSEITVCDLCFTCYYKNFGQYKALSFILGDYLCSLVHPLNSAMTFDVRPLRAYFESLGVNP
jgi:4'-phosphopantetheinyl transferase EntD